MLLQSDTRCYRVAERGSSSQVWEGILTSSGSAAPGPAQSSLLPSPPRFPETLIAGHLSATTWLLPPPSRLARPASAAERSGFRGISVLPSMSHWIFESQKLHQGH